MSVPALERDDLKAIYIVKKITPITLVKTSITSQTYTYLMWPQHLQFTPLATFKYVITLH